ncbi:MAG: hypothetical protein MPJ25_03885 [Pirellulales bacterium]|nr:hypothetical protein [Pirellulales bacterium]
MADNKIKVYEDISDFTQEPNQAASAEEKATIEYGMKVAKSIEARWFYRSNEVSLFSNNFVEFEQLRLYARGEQDVELYKSQLDQQEGDTSFNNLDWQPVQIIPKFVDIIKNGMKDRSYSIKATAQDQLATEERERFKKRLMKERDNFVELQRIQQTTGVDVFENKPSEIPFDDDDLDVYLSLKGKQDVEVALESSIDYVFDLNEYDDVIKDKCLRDTIEIGMSAVKHSFDVNDGVKVEYVDPATLVYSDTESPFFDDVYYIGEVRTMTIANIRKMFPHLTAEEIDRIRLVGNAFRQYQNISNYRYRYHNTEEDPNEVDVLFFSWKTVDSTVHKIGKNRASGTSKATKKESSFDPKKDERIEVARKYEEVVYEGVKVLGDSEAASLLSWGKAENMVRKASSTINVVMPQIICAPNFYKGRVDSIVKRIIKFADQIQLTHLKIQQVVQRTVTGGIFIDADGITQIDLGNGSTYGPQDALDMYFQTGSIIGRSTTRDGDPNPGKLPIQELQGSSMQQLEGLIVNYNFYLDQIRQVTGVNEVREGATPAERSLVGVQKLAAANSNVATRHIMDAMKYVTTRAAEGISLRMSDIFKYGKKDNPELISHLKSSIGKYNTEIIEDIDDIHYHDYGIFFELGPDAEAEAFLEQNIQQALAKDNINLEDAIDVRSLGKKSSKLANKLLASRRRKKALVDQQLQQQNIQAQAQANAQSTAAAEQAKAKTIQIEYAAKLELERAKAQFEQQKLQTEKQGQIELMNHEFQLNQRAGVTQEMYAERQIKQKGDQEVQKEKMKGQQQAFESVGYDKKLDGNLKDRDFTPR